MPLKNESEPIEDDEWLYRRVHADRFRTTKTPFVSPGAFEPRIKGKFPDTDGISLFRADCLDSPKDVLSQISNEEKRRKNGVVKVSVQEVKSLGLEVVSTPDNDILGHVSIPKLSSEEFTKNKEACKLHMDSLAKFASIDGRVALKPEPTDPLE